MSESAAERTPPEIWEKIIYRMGRRELSSLTRTSKPIRGYTLPLLYGVFEVSLCKCSDTYYNLLSRTISENQELANFVEEIVIDFKSQCQVNTNSSTDDTSVQAQIINQLNVLGLIRGNPLRPNPSSDWKQDAINTLLKKKFLESLSHLNNVKEITLILGKYQQLPNIPTAILDAIPKTIVSQLRLLKIGDTSIANLPKALIPSKLCTLDLAYVGVDDRQLCTFISQNSDSLETINLQYVVETSQSPLFAKYNGSRLKRLESFSIAGPQNVSSSGVLQMFGCGQSLKQLKLESLPMFSAISWTSVLTDLAIPTADCVKGMDVVSFGAATGCFLFWDSVVAFLRGRCGSELKKLVINGSTKGSDDVLYPRLFDYLLEVPQNKLTSFTLMWRDHLGLHPEQASQLSRFCPSVTMLHLCILFPTTEASPTDLLLTIVSSFQKLKRLHLTFLAKSSGGDEDELSDEEQRASEAYSAAMQKIKLDVNKRGPVFTHFVHAAVRKLPNLEEVSWSIYDRANVSAADHKAYVQITRLNNEGSNSFSPSDAKEDGLKDYQIEDLSSQLDNKNISSNSLPYKCIIGSKRVFLSQKPGWRDEMGNSFSRERRVCPYAYPYAFYQHFPSNLSRRYEL